MGRQPAKNKIDVSALPPLYKCTKCGKISQDPKGHFFMARTFELYDGNEHYSHVCCSCVNEYFNQMKIRHRDEKTALILTCCAIGLYFSDDLYESVKDTEEIKFGNYIKKLNINQFRSKNFSTYLLSLLKQLSTGREIYESVKNTQWTVQEQRNKNEVIGIIGYDPFENYTESDRRYLFSELIKYFDEDIAEDTYKLSQIIQVVNNNNQIRLYDLTVSRLDPIKDGDTIKTLNQIKSGLVSSNDKIAKENEISVKNRSNKELGKSTLGYLQRDLREKDFKEAETNYYDQLTSVGSQWAVDMSHKAILQNALFDENDKQEIFEMQREKIVELQRRLDDEMEKSRNLTLHNNELKALLDAGGANG